ncbi:MAG: hypothetical protein HZB39_05050 [Planctomycetes bacterium]|nr:hypothetical protein [Planctomycetota bacterium]
MPTGTRIAVACAALLVACSSRPPLSPLDPRPVRERESWTAEVEGRAVGKVVLLEIEDPAGAVRLYRVENDSGQWLGWVDTAGRVWQRVPFREDDLFRGVYPMEKGLSLLYEVAVPVRLSPRDGGPAEADHRRGRDQTR